MSELLVNFSPNYEDTFKQEEGLQDYLNAPVPLKGGGSAPAVDLLLRFARSKYGKHMATEQELRYSQRFGFDPDQMLEYLGRDINPLGHMHHTAILSAKILKAQVDSTGELPIPEEKVGTVIFNDGRHDTGEPTHKFIKKVVGNVIGDIPAGNKKPEDRVVEAEVRKFFHEPKKKRHAKHVIWNDVADEAWYSGEIDIGHWDTEGSTYRVSHTSHDIGTHEVSQHARSAYEKLKQDPTADPHTLRQLERLHTIVAPCVDEAIGQAAVCLAYANDYAMRHGIYVPAHDSNVA